MPEDIPAGHVRMTSTMMPSTEGTQVYDYFCDVEKVGGYWHAGLGGGR